MQRLPYTKFTAESAECKDMIIRLTALTQHALSSEPPFDDVSTQISHKTLAGQVQTR